MIDRIYLGADIHIPSDLRDVETAVRIIKNFCRTHDTTKRDVLILLGDTQVNTNAYVRDRMVKKMLEDLPITIVILYGNHEVRVEDVPRELADYKIEEWQGGRVHVEEKFPSLIFLIDGEIYDLKGKSTLAIGGAHSIDQWIRKRDGRLWSANEKPSDAIKKKTENKLTELGWKVDIVLSHTVPIKYMPKEALLAEHPWYIFDNTTEIWLDQIRENLDYGAWFCGHFHIDKDIDKIHFLFIRFWELQ